MFFPRITDLLFGWNRYGFVGRREDNLYGSLAIISTYTYDRAADVTDDGEINNKDLGLLQRMSTVEALRYFNKEGPKQ